MSGEASTFIVGIDLGTSHTVVAYAEAGVAPRVFSIPQLVTATEIGARPMLSSSLYAPVPGETVADPWDEAPFTVGEFARSRGTAVPGRLVASAKSWLSHLGVDRDAPILPWGSDDQVDLARVSPVEASASYLRHVRKAWDEAHPAHRLATQQVVLTVPASFDQSARELTLEAARRAGLAVKLLEEPQAAFYDFMQRSAPEVIDGLLASTNGEALVLVCDIGGGTTDLSLVELRARSGADAVDRHPGSLRFAVSRIAVGHHLLLGGDNMDLALAYLCEPRISSDKLDPGRFSQLVSSCRAAKEHLFARAAPDDYPVTILSGGSQLIGASRSTRLARREVEELLLGGFFPEVTADSSAERKRSALVGFGLPYERDVAITRHVASFLRRHAGDLTGGGPATRRGPDALLLNGGVFRATAMADRLRSVIQSWGGPPLRVLSNEDPDLAVARGAVTYGQSLGGRGVRIESNSARGYYVGLEAPRAGERRRLVSVVPRGAREAVVHRVEGRTFGLVVGRPVRFDLFASDDAPVHPPGEVVPFEDDKFLALPPVAVHFEKGESGRSQEMLVVLEGELTPVGTLDLACVEIGSSEKRRYRLAFELRKDAAPVASSSAPPSPHRSTHPGSRRWSEAAEAIDRVFGKSRADVAPRLVKDLVRELERILGERASWNIELSRTLFDEVVQGRASRRRSPDHERTFWMLAGYTIRPGFGDPRDAARIEALGPLFSEMLLHQGEARGWQQFWIAWRRAAGGVGEPLQTAIRDEIDPFLAPPEARLKKRKGIRPLALDDMLDMASLLERLPPPKRAELGSWVLERTWTDRDHRLFSAIGRLGARTPMYASVHHVVAKAIVEGWLDHLLREKWDEVPAAAEASVSLARMTGDRARDVGAGVRAEVEKKLVRSGAKEEWVRAVREVVPVRDADRAHFFGDSLPAGLRLVD